MTARMDRAIARAADLSLPRGVDPAHSEADYRAYSRYVLRRSAVLVVQWYLVPLCAIGLVVLVCTWVGVR